MVVESRRSDGREGRTDGAALRHPLWWGALSLLLVNDHLLKGSGLLPGWLTGKLSDVAGLVVAPVLLSALLRARTRRRRALAFLAVSGWFVAANLVPAVARATGELAGLAGLSWTFWADPTDLVALAVLPLAWRLAARGRLRAGGRLSEELGLALGLAACVASPTPQPSWTTEAFLYNDTGRDVDLRVRWVEAAVDCEAVRGHYAEALSRDAFGPGTLFHVLAGSTLPLDRGLADPGTSPDPAAPPAPPAETENVGTCDVAILSGPGLSETVVFWEGLEPRVIPDVVEGGDDLRAVEGGLRLVADEGDAARVVLQLPAAGYRAAPPVDVYDGGARCHDYGTIQGFDWSELPPWEGARVRLRAVRPTLDGCVEVALEPEDGSRARDAFVCVPPEDFPFLPNSVLRIWSGPTQLRIVRDLELDDGSVWRTGELVVVRGVGRLDEGPFALELVDVDAGCLGVREACGGFRVPAAGGLREGATTRFVHPGEAVERDAADGRRARLRVGRAERMWVTHPACGAGRDELGPRLEALVVYGEERR